MSSRRHSWTHRDGLIAALLFASSLGIFVRSPIHHVSDSQYSMLLGHSLLERGSFDLAPYMAPPLDPARYPGIVDSGLPYHIEAVGPHRYYGFPAGSSILSLPFIAAMETLGYELVAPDGIYSKRSERKIQVHLAGLLMAAFCVGVYAVSRRQLPAGWSLGLAIVVALATPVWSTASRVLWSHTWLLVSTGAAAALLCVDRTRDRPWMGALLATLLAWAFFCRPTAAIPALLVGAALFAQRAPAAPAYAATLAGWLALFAGHSLVEYGQPLPPYYLPSRLGGANFTTALAGHWISPSRGLLVFCPQLLFVAYLALRYRGQLAQRALMVLAASIVALHWVAVSGFPHWWGGQSYGPRLMTDALPWLIVSSLGALAAWRRGLVARSGVAAQRRFAREAAAGVALALLGTAMHGVGAFSEAAAHWTEQRIGEPRAPERLWDWTDPQFLAWRSR